MVNRDQLLQSLRNKLAASQRLGGGYEARVKAIEAEIARLEKENDDASE